MKLNLFCLLLHRQALTALGTAALDNKTTRFGFRTCKETVHAQTPTPTKLTKHKAGVGYTMVGGHVKATRGDNDGLGLALD